MDDGSPTLEVGFAIDTGGSFEALAQLGSMMDSVEAKILREAKAIEQATSGMINIGGQTAAISAFASTTSAAFLKAEQAAERMTYRLSEQAATFGMTRAAAAAWRAEQAGATGAANELRAAEATLNTLRDQAAVKTEAEAKAVRDAADAYRAFEAAAKQNMAAYNSQQAAAAADQEAQALREAALAYQRFNAVAKEKMATYNNDQAAQLQREATAAKSAADEHARLAAMVRGSHDAQEADAVAAERLRESTDAVYAATKRVNAQIAESTRLYRAGATAPTEYARQQAVLNTQLENETAALGGATRGHGAHANAAGLSRNAQMELTHVFKASFDQITAGASPTQILTMHIGQLGQIATMTEGGVWGLTKALGGMVAGVLPIVAPLAVVAGVAFAAFKQFQGQVKDSGELTRYRDSLGLTHKEMLQLSDGVDKAGDKIKHLSDVTITAGDMMAGLWEAVKNSASNSTADDIWEKIKSGGSSAFAWILNAWDVTAAGISAGIYGTYNAVKVVWGNFPAVFGDLFVQGANAAISALNTLVKAGVDGLNYVISQANRLPHVNIAQITPPQIAQMENANAGAAARMGTAVKTSFSDAFQQARKENAALWQAAGNNAKQHAKARMKDEADALKENRTPKTPKVDHNALNSEAVEAQIKNLYKLADAYGISGAAALIAEAREKAESKAIKSRADIEAAVDQQIRLSIAQRVADAAKATAGMNDQANAQEQVNAQVASGLVPASQASQILQDQLALLPLVAAQKAAQQEADKAGAAGNLARQAQFADAAKRAGDQLAAETAAQQRLNKAKAEAQFNAATETGNDQLAQMREELRLVGETDEARVHALAALKATLDADRMIAAGLDPAKAAAYVAQQVALADGQQRLKEQQDAYNASLTLTADKWDIIASKVQAAGQGMADAFGTAGKALGDLASSYASYEATRARLTAEHDVAIRNAGHNETLIAQANGRFALQSAGLQVAAYGDMAEAAKGFFKANSTGYKVMDAAEKAFRAVQLALAVKSALEQIGLIGTHVAAKVVGDTAMAASDTARAGVEQGNSLATTAVKAVEAVVNAIKSLPFPLNLAAGAATAAAIAALGVSIVGGFGGSKSTLTPANDGTGTVLGDSTAKSDSIKNALDDLKNVDTLMLTSSHAMQASLKSIDSQIGSFAAEIVKGGDINASSNITAGFKTSGLGSILSNIPLIGGFLSSLFGTRTDITGTGLYGGAQTIGSINAGGYNAQSYSDVEKTSKFFGIVTGHSYSTQYGNLDSAVDSQFTLILKSFDKAIAAAAGPLGDATDAVQARLDSFVVNIGKIDLQGLSGADIQTKLENVFGALGDQMASYVFPEITQFQKVGEGALETLTRVASTVESVTAGLNELGISTKDLGIAAQVGIASQFDSITDLTSATDTYFADFYTSAEQAAAKTAQFSKVFDSLGLAMPSSLAGFRQLVEAQDLTTAAGQSTYATLLQLAPAFADLQSSMTGAKSAADILSERTDLQRQLLELQGDTAAVRALDLAKVDASNQALQEQVWAVSDAQDAAKAAATLADAWKSVGDSIMDEINRIRGLNDTAGDGSFASLMAQFNAATTAARAGDQTAAKTLPQLSQALLTAAANAATSRQELDRVQGQTAASLQATYDAINALAATPATAVVAAAPAPVAVTPVASVATSNAALLSAAATSQASTSSTVAANDDTASAISALHDEVASMRTDLNTGQAAIANNTSRTAKILDLVSSASGGDAFQMANIP